MWMPDRLNETDCMMYVRATRSMACFKGMHDAAGAAQPVAGQPQPGLKDDVLIKALHTVSAVN